jgi:hypothetical protein
MKPWRRARDRRTPAFCTSARCSALIALPGPIPAVWAKCLLHRFRIFGFASVAADMFNIQHSAMASPYSISVLRFRVTWCG